MRELYWLIFITKGIKCAIFTFVETIKKNCCLYLNVKEKKNRFTKKRKKRKKKKTETKTKKISMACRRSNTWLKLDSYNRSTRGNKRQDDINILKFSQQNSHHKMKFDSSPNTYVHENYSRKVTKN